MCLGRKKEKKTKNTWAHSMNPSRLGIIRALSDVDRVMRRLIFNSFRLIITHNVNGPNEWVEPSSHLVPS